MKKKDLSIIIPIYYDEEVINELYRRLINVLEGFNEDFEIVFIDDGSKDKSFELLLKLHANDNRLKIIRLSRNFGQQNAIKCGLDNSIGEIIVIMDSDLQDRPEDIPKLIEAMEIEQKDMAIAQWIEREDSLKKKFFSKLFFNVSKKITDLNHEPNLGVFRVLKRTALDQLITIPEKTGTILSLMYWSGIEYAIVKLKREKRFGGTSGYNLRKMLRLTADRIFSYSLFPIRIASILGIIIGLLSFLFGIFLVVRKFLFDDLAAGWTSTVVSTFFLFRIKFFLFRHYWRVPGPNLSRDQREA